jgi:hypothetical protein
VKGWVGDEIVENARNAGSGDFLIKPVPKKAPSDSIGRVTDMARLSCRR